MLITSCLIEEKAIVVLAVDNSSGCRTTFVKEPCYSSTQHQIAITVQHMKGFINLLNDCATFDKSSRQPGTKKYGKRAADVDIMDPRELAKYVLHFIVI